MYTPVLQRGKTISTDKYIPVSQRQEIISPEPLSPQFNLDISPFCTQTGKSFHGV